MRRGVRYRRRCGSGTDGGEVWDSDIYFLLFMRRIRIFMMNKLSRYVLLLGWGRCASCNAGFCLREEAGRRYCSSASVTDSRDFGRGTFSHGWCYRVLGLSRRRGHCSVASRWHILSLGGGVGMVRCLRFGFDQSYQQHAPFFC